MNRTHPNRRSFQRSNFASHKPTKRSAKVSRCLFESLETRRLLAAFQVTNLLDAGTGSLRHAIEQANASPGADVISFATSGTIALGGTQLPMITDDLQILGPAGGLTIDANHTSRIFQIAEQATVHLHKMTLTNGEAGLFNSQNPLRPGEGGLIRNAGKLIITHSTLSNSFARGGGAIYSTGPLTIDNSVITGNKLTGSAAGSDRLGRGAGIFIEGANVTVNATTIAQNDNEISSGGGIAVFNGTLEVAYSTLWGNKAWNFGSAVVNTGTSTSTVGTVTLINSTISGNITGAALQNIEGGTMKLVHCTLANNGIGVLSRNGSTLVLHNSLFSASEVTTSGSVAVTDVGNVFSVPATSLGPLQGNGGPTLTHALLPGSPQVGRGALGVSTPADQRGRLRGSSIDPGAFQTNAGTSVGFGRVVTTLVDEDNGTSDPAVGAGTSLREAMKSANFLTGEDTIVFAVGGTITLGGAQLPTITDTSGLEILRAGAPVTISGNNQSRIFDVAVGAALNLTNLTMTAGNAGSANGGAIRNLGSLTVSDSVISASSSGTDGGGIFAHGSLAMYRSSVIGNSAVGRGGGVCADNASYTIDGCTFSGNTGGGDGGGALLRNNPVASTIVNSTFSGNSANYAGGLVLMTGTPVTLSHVTIASNSGGGLRTHADPLPQMNNSIVANNPGGDTNGTLPGGNNLFGTVSLGSLADNGGPTMTHRLLDSRGFDAANPAIAPASDQRGVPRNAPGVDAGSAPDIGAYERINAFVVDTLQDDNDGLLRNGTSLRDAIHFANVNPGPDVIRFDLSPGTLTLSCGQLPTISGELSIVGPGAANLTISGNNATRILEVGAGVDVELSRLTIADSLTSQFGAVRNLGTLKVSDSVFANNANTFTGSAAIYNGGTLTVVGSAFVNNTARSAVAIGSITGATFTVINSTFSGNHATAAGGSAIRNFRGTATIINSTISGNLSDGTGNETGAIWTYQDAVGGITTLHNSIVANNIGGDTAGPFTGSHNLFGTLALEPLANLGGSTPVHRLPAGSPALDAANPALAPLTDQRGAVRDDSPPDIGAYEEWHGTLRVTTLVDEDNATPDPFQGAGTSLREAMQFANGNPGRDAIAFDVSGVIELVGRRVGTITIVELPTVTDSLDIHGPADELTIDARGIGAVLNIGPNVVATLSDLTITGANGFLGAIFNRGQLTITDAVLRNNIARSPDLAGTIQNLGALEVVNTVFSENGAQAAGGIVNANHSATTTVRDSTFLDNRGAFGGSAQAGAILSVGGIVTVENSTFAGNRGTSAGGIYSQAGTVNVSNSTFSGNIGRGIRNETSWLNVVNSTFSGNSVSGSGQFGSGGAIFVLSGFETNVINSTITGNSAGGGGGGIYSHFGSALRLQNSIVAGNTGPGGAPDDIDFDEETIHANSRNNLVGHAPDTGLVNSVNGNIVGVTDPMLAPLADNGGPSKTHALLPGGPAIDVGDRFFDPADSGILFDQRGQGFARVERATDGPTRDYVGLAEIRFGSSSGQVITPTAAFASSYYGNTQRPQNLINGSGLDSGSSDIMNWTHAPSGTAVGMWHAGAGQGTQGAAPLVGSQYVVLDLGANYDLSNAYLWQMVQTNLLARGVKHFRLLASSNAPDPAHAANPPPVYDLTGFTEILGPTQLAANLQGGPAPTQAFELNGATNVRQVYIDVIDNYTTGPRVDIGAFELKQPLAPVVHGSNFPFLTAPHSLQFTFSQDVSASLGTDDIVLENLTTSQTIPASDLSVFWDSGTQIATFRNTAGNGILPDGDYRATLLASGITNPDGTPLEADHEFEFFFLNGDANRDRIVNLADFNLLAANFGQSQRSFSQGDFNYDMIVNLSDFNILAARFGVALDAGPQSVFSDADDEDGMDLLAKGNTAAHAKTGPQAESARR